MMRRFLQVGALDTPVCGQPGFDPWNKVWPVLGAINVTFTRYFLAPQHISIDESMTGMKNCIVQLQYMLNKHHSRFGIKKFELCESVTGYVLHVELYAGKDFPLLKAGTLLARTVRANSKGLPLLPSKMRVGKVINYHRQGCCLLHFGRKSPKENLC